MLVRLLRDLPQCGRRRIVMPAPQEEAMTSTLLWIALWVCLLALVFVATSPNADAMSVDRTRFPELALFKTKDEARRAMIRSLRSVRGAHVGAFVLVGLPLFLVVAVAFSSTFALLSRHVVLPDWLQSVVGCVVVGSISGAAITRLLSKRIRRCLREELVKSQQPVCTGCGYNVTGNTSGVCPECGKGIQRG